MRTGSWKGSRLWSKQLCLDIWPVGSCYMRSWPGQLGETLSYSRRKSCISEEGHHHRCMLKEGKLIVQRWVTIGGGGSSYQSSFQPCLVPATSIYQCNGSRAIQDQWCIWFDVLEKSEQDLVTQIRLDRSLINSKLREV